MPFRLIRLLARVALVLAVLAYGGAYSWALDLIDAFRLHLVLIAGILAVVALMFRLWGAALTSVAAGVLAAAGLGPVYDDPISSVPTDGPEIVLVYANLYDLNSVPGAAAAALADLDADILVTSETPAASAEPLNSAYPYRVPSPAPQPAGARNLRTIIWSRIPLREGAALLNNTVAPTAAFALADLGTAELHITGAHFARAFQGLRDAQIAGLAAIPVAPETPRIIIGDFNAEPWSWAVTGTAQATGTTVLGGYRVTWAGGYPTPLGRLPVLWGHEIDHVLHSGQVLVRTAEALAVPGSDHRALRIRLQIADD